MPNQAKPNQLYIHINGRKGILTDIKLLLLHKNT